MSNLRFRPEDWAAIEPVLSEAVNVLVNRQKALQNEVIRQASLAKWVGEIVAGGAPSELTPRRKLRKAPKK